MNEHSRPVWWQRGLRRVAIGGVTLGVVAGAGGAVFFGADYLAARATAATVTTTADLTPVEVTALTVQDGYTLSRQFVGQVEAAASVVLSFELGGRLSDLQGDEGAEVVKGQVLARLDTALLNADKERLEASRAATTAQLDLAETRLARAQSLLRDGHVSQEAVDQALATRDELSSRIREIDAALHTVAINLEKSELRAPFDGRIGLRNVDGGETLSAGTPVLTLIETAAPQVRVGLPLSIETATLTNAMIDVNGKSYPATLAQVRPDIDPVTRTRTVLFELGAETPPAFGQTATLMIETRIATPGTWIPLDALREGIGGAWTVLVVEDGTVRTAMVEVLHADETRAFVSGTFPPGARMIRSGAHRVVPGQRVEVIATAPVAEGA
ncbi:RND family efflux transporter MFP subunit [Rubricella aquisinus]|uniref:RND family efflux transporter MFP subunit n=1 Tax=Rubricella aquisinus TaxID=2028108 RepID=A0A840WLI9_9RHOB|nr:efflux RND transporter periplasmic adaptor subunit [Rubricella aquisinus]MBB5515391.1 RND family efflux transporter MFP subunit [Rubricella aquisinus]